MSISPQMENGDKSRVIFYDSMRKLIFVSILSALTLWSCTDDVQTDQSTMGLGGINLGGVFRVNEVQDFRNLYPLNITEDDEHLAL